jgi:hypothetical protein
MPIFSPYFKARFHSLMFTLSTAHSLSEAQEGCDERQRRDERRRHRRMGGDGVMIGDKTTSWTRGTRGTRGVRGGGTGGWEATA